MKKKPIMFMGCSSDAGKSFLTAAFCRHLSNHGIKIAPFKAQNMSNNAAITDEGLEISRAQYLQAIAAKTKADPRMNPLLLKPMSDTYSHAIFMGKYDEELSNTSWLSRREKIWPAIKESLHSLINDYDQVVIEGAGSPAEINLRPYDMVNMSIALEANADVYLIADIDRGGAFAHLLGTFLALNKSEQSLIKGFILNKFRGDQSLLLNAPDWLKDQTGIPVSAVVPMIKHCLPEEDGFFHKENSNKSNHCKVGLIIYPYASNLEEFDPLVYGNVVSIVPIKEKTYLDSFDAIILPGSKNTVKSYEHLINTGLDKEIINFAKKNKFIFGVCGGMQILGNEILDPNGVEGSSSKCLGLLDISTLMLKEKVTQKATLNWQGSTIEGYEIHHGLTTPGSNVNLLLENNLGFYKNNIYGLYPHGLLENERFIEWFYEKLDLKVPGTSWSKTLNQELDRVATLINFSDIIQL